MVALSFAIQPGAWLGIEPLNLGHCLAMWSMTTKVATTKSSSSDDKSFESQIKLLKKIISIIHCTLRAKRRTPCGRGGVPAGEEPSAIPVQVEGMSKQMRVRLAAMECEADESGGEASATGARGFSCTNADKNVPQMRL